MKDLIKGKDIFGRRIIKIPTPKFVVFYNGREKRPETELLRLSDAFENQVESPELELVCKVYNINPDMNDELKRKCPVLMQFMQFIEKIRSNEAADEAKPIESAIEWCIHNDIFREFLSDNKSEVLRAMTIDMTFEKREEIIRRDERAEGRAEGIAVGRNTGREELLIELVRDNILSISVAAAKAGMTEEEFAKLV